MSEVKLTRLSHGGGCGCKIAPALLHEILGVAKEKLQFANLLVGTETSGGLLVADAVLSAFNTAGFVQAPVTDSIKHGAARAQVN